MKRHLKNNTQKLIIESNYEQMLADKDKIIKLQEDKICYLEKLFSVKTVFTEIKTIQNEKIEKEKRRRLKSVYSNKKKV